MNFKLWLEENEKFFNENFKTQREKFIQQGYEANIVDDYLNQFKKIKDIKQVRDPIKGTETVGNRIDIDSYKDFKQLVALVKYVNGQVDVAGKTKYKDIKVDATPIFKDDDLIIYYADSPQACVKYKGTVPYEWCVSRNDVTNMYNVFRYKEKTQPAFYFVKNIKRTQKELSLLNLITNFNKSTFKDKYHFFVIQVIKDANIQDKETKQYIVTSALNDGDERMSWNEIVNIEPQLANKQELFKPVRFTEKEQKLYDRFKDFISDEEFDELPYDEKDAYLNIYVGLSKKLTDNQFKSLPQDLKNKYIGLGIGLTPEQLKMIDNKLYKRYEEVTKTVIDRIMETDSFKKITPTQFDIFIKNINDYDLNKMTENNIFWLIKNLINKNVVNINEIAKTIIKNRKQLSENNITTLCNIAQRKDDEMLKLIIQKNLKLHDDNVHKLLLNAENPDEIAELIIEKKPDLTGNDIFNLVDRPKNKDEIAELIIEKKPDLTYNNVETLLRNSKNTDKIAELIAQKNPEHAAKFRPIFQKYGRIP